jgi:hypothetical protein
MRSLLALDMRIAVIGIFSCRERVDPRFDAVDSFTPENVVPVAGECRNGFYGYGELTYPTAEWLGCGHADDVGLAPIFAVLQIEGHIPCDDVWVEECDPCLIRRPARDSQERVVCPHLRVR